MAWLASPVFVLPSLRLHWVPFSSIRHIDTAGWLGDDSGPCGRLARPDGESGRLGRGMDG